MRWHRSFALPHSTGGSPAIRRFVGISPPSPRRVLAHFSSSFASLRHSHMCEGATRMHVGGMGERDAGVKREPRELRLFFLLVFFLPRLCRADCGGGDKTCRSATVSLGRRWRVEGRGGASIFSWSPTRPRLASVRDVVTDRCLLERPAVHQPLRPSRLGKAAAGVITQQGRHSTRTHTP